MKGTGVEYAAAAEDDEVDFDAALGQALGDGEGLLLGATVAEVVLEDGYFLWVDGGGTVGIGLSACLWRDCWARVAGQGFVFGPMDEALFFLLACNQWLGRGFNLL